MLFNTLLLIPLVCAAGFGLILTPLCIRLAFRWGVIDDPANRKIHSKRTAYLGGIALFAAAILGTALAIPLCGTLYAFDIRQMQLVGLATIGAVILGLIDDKYHIRARHKLLGQVLIAVGFVLVGYRIQTFALPNILLDVGLFGLPLTIFWIVAMINAFNLIDGMDGLAGTAALTASSMLVVFAMFYNALGLAIMALAVFGATAAFLVYNWNPAKIFLGDAGSLGLGTFFATALLTVGNRGPNGLRFTESPDTNHVPFQIISLTFVLIYPAMELLLTVLRRLLRGKPVSTADRGHLHHHLLAQGWRPSWICMMVVVVSILAQGPIMALLVHNLGLAVWLLAMLGLVLGILMYYLGLFDLLNPLTVRYFRPHYLIANHLISMLRLKMTLTTSAHQVLSLINNACRELGVLKYSLSYVHQTNQSTVHREWLNPDEPGLHGRDENDMPIAEPSIGHSDRFEDPRSGAVAVWVFKLVEREEELDIEYRVLMSTFMEAAVRQLTVLPHLTEGDLIRKSAVMDISVSAINLRGSKTDYQSEAALTANHPRGGAATDANNPVAVRQPGG